MPTLQESDDDSDEIEDDDEEEEDEDDDYELAMRDLQGLMRQEFLANEASKRGRRPDTPGLRKGFLARPSSSAVTSSRSVASAPPGPKLSAQGQQDQNIRQQLKVRLLMS